MTTERRPLDPGSAPDVQAPMGWRAAMVAAARVVQERPVLAVVGLLGFLARGGLVAFVLPIVALPTPTGISNFIGGTALTGSGASEGLVRLIVAAIALVVLAVAGGAVLGALADLLLARAAVAAASEHAAGLVTEHGPERITRGLLGRLLMVRAITLVPVAIAVSWAATRLVAAGYHQLILPDDLRLPLALRILLEALDAAVVVLAVWLAAEWIGGVAVRHVIVDRRSVPGALLATVAGIARRPVTSLGTMVLGVIGVVVAAGPALLVAAALWSRLQAMLADDVSVLLLLPATFIFVGVWASGLGAVGAVTAWRTVAGTLDVLRTGRARVAADATTDAGTPTPAGPPAAVAGAMPAVAVAVGPPAAPAAPEVALLEG